MANFAVPYNINDPAAGVEKQSGPGTPYVNANVNAGMFGAQEGEALSKLGATAGQAANEASNAALQLQQVQNEATVSDVYSNKFSVAFRDQYQKYYALQGKDAMEKLPEFQTNMEKLRQDARDGLASPAQQRMFDQISRKRVEMELDGMVRHADQEQKKYELSASDAVVQTHIDSLADKWNDPIARDQYFRSIQAEVVGYGATHGQSNEVVKQRLQKAYDTGWGSVIARVGVNNPGLGLKMIDLARQGKDVNGQPTEKLSGPAANLLYQHLFPAARQEAVTLGSEQTLAEAKADWLRSKANSGEGVVSGVDGYVERVTAPNGPEGTGQNPKSSAVGTGQFIDQTWLDMMKKYGGQIGKDDLASQIERGADGKLFVRDDATRAQIMGLRQDATVGKHMTKMYASENAQELTKNGVAVNASNLYLAHFLGPADAVKVLKADPSTPLQGLIRDGSINANERVLKGKTAADAVAYAQGAMGGVQSGIDNTGMQSFGDHLRTRAEAIGNQEFNRVYAETGNATLAKSQRENTMARIQATIHAEDMQNTALGHSIAQAVAGELPQQKGVKPKTPEEIMALSPELKQTWLTLQTTNPTAIAGFMNQLQSNGGADVRAYGESLHEGLAAALAPGAKSIYAPDSPVNKMFSDKKLTVAGMNYIHARVAAQGAPGGQMDNVLLQSSLERVNALAYDPAAKGEAIPRSDGTGSRRVADARAALIEELKNGEREGKTYSQMLDTRDKNNVIDRVLHQYGTMDYKAEPPPNAQQVAVTANSIAQMQTEDAVIAAAKGTTNPVISTAARNRLMELNPAKYGQPAKAATPAAAPTAAPQAPATPAAPQPTPAERKAAFDDAALRGVKNVAGAVSDSFSRLVNQPRPDYSGKPVDGYYQGGR